MFRVEWGNGVSQGFVNCKSLYTGCVSENVLILQVSFPKVRVDGWPDLGQSWRWGEERNRKERKAWKTEIEISKGKWVKSTKLDHLYADSPHSQPQVCVKSVYCQQAIVFFKIEKQMIKEIVYVFISCSAGVLFWRQHRIIKILSSYCLGMLVEVTNLHGACKYFKYRFLLLTKECPSPTSESEEPALIASHSSPGFLKKDTFLCIKAPRTSSRAEQSPRISVWVYGVSSWNQKDNLGTSSVLPPSSRYSLDVMAELGNTEKLLWPASLFWLLIFYPLTI